MKNKKRYSKINHNLEFLKDKSDDFYENYHYSVELMEVIDNYFNSADKHPLYVALTGSWGSGKTVVANSSIFQLKKIKKYKKNLNVYVYDAWKYKGDSFRRTFTESIAKQSKDPSALTDAREKMYFDKQKIKKNYTEKIKRILKSSKFYIAITLLFLMSVILYSVFDLAKLKIFFLTVQAILMGCFAKLSLNYHDVLNFLETEVTITQGKFFSPEQFYNTVDKLLKKDKSKYKIIFIDNIDRCDSSDFKELIYSIKGFFDVQTDKIVYLIPFDKKQFSDVYGDNALEYSQKIFNHSIDIKDKEPRNTIEFINKALNNNEEYRPIFPPDVIGLLSTFNLQTPRSILNFMDTYITEYNLLSLKMEETAILDDDLTYLIKYCYLKNKYPIFFDYSHQDWTRIEKIEKQVFEGYDYERILKENKEVNNYFNQEIFDYLKSTDIFMASNYQLFYSENISENYSIPTKIINDINSKKYELVIEYYLDNKTAVLKYLKSSLIENVAQFSWKSLVAPKLEFIFFLLEEGNIDVECVNEFDFIFNKKQMYNNLILGNTKNIKSILMLATLLKPEDILFKHIEKNIVMNYENLFKEEKDKDICSKIFLTFKLDATQVIHLEEHVNDLLTENLFFKDEHYNLIKSKNITLISPEIIIKILQGMPEDKIDFVSDFIELVKDALNVNKDSTILFDAYIDFINKNANKLTDELEIINMFKIIDDHADPDVFDDSFLKINFDLALLKEFSFSILDLFYQLYLKTENKIFLQIYANYIQPQHIKLLINHLINLTEEKDANLEVIEQITSKIISDIEADTMITAAKEFDVLSTKSENLSSYIIEKAVNFDSNKTLDYYQSISNNENKNEIIDSVLMNLEQFEEYLEYFPFVKTSLKRFDTFLDTCNEISQIPQILDNKLTSAYLKKVFAKLSYIIKNKESFSKQDIENILNLSSKDGFDYDVFLSITGNNTDLDELNQIITFFQEQKKLSKIKQIRHIRSYLKSVEEKSL